VFTGGEFDARIDAGTGKGVIYGGAGTDTLIGRGGDTYLDWYDEEGSNWTEFNLNEDTFMGGAGDDVLRAVNGNEMIGGTGADRFEVIYQNQDLPDGRAYLPARITDFDLASDTLAVSTSDAEGGAWSVVAWAEGLGADVLLGATVVASVTGG
jgi:Ca2+-binding RTX toxin-like protein